MKVLGGWLYCKCVMHTSCEKEKERMDMLEPIGDDVEEFFAKGDEGERVMRIYDTCVVRIDAITDVENAGMGHCTIYTRNTRHMVFGTVEEFIEAMK